VDQTEGSCRGCSFSCHAEGGLQCFPCHPASVLAADSGSQPPQSNAAPLSEAVCPTRQLLAGQGMLVLSTRRWQKASTKARNHVRSPPLLNQRDGPGLVQTLSAFQVGSASYVPCSGCLKASPTVIPACPVCGGEEECSANTLPSSVQQALHPDCQQLRNLIQCRF